MECYQNKLFLRKFDKRCSILLILSNLAFLAPKLFLGPLNTKKMFLKDIHVWTLLKCMVAMVTYNANLKNEGVPVLQNQYYLGCC